MEESAPKRRRTSPRTSIPIHPTTSNQSLEKSNDSAPETEIGRDQSQGRNRRPSFASPTKASLSRSNPDILERRESLRRNGDNDSAGKSTTRASRGRGKARESGLREMLAQQAQAARRRDGETPSLASQPSHDEHPSSTGTPSRGPARRAGGSFAASPRRSPAKPSPRPLPAPESDSSNDEEFNPFAGRVLNRTPPIDSQPQAEAASAQTQNQPRSEEAAQPAEPEAPATVEPELPPTPTQQGRDDPVVTTPPEGIHDKTPSRRARRRSDREMKSSPLKAPPLRPSELGGEPPPFHSQKSEGKGKGKAPVVSASQDHSAILEDEGFESHDQEDTANSGPHPARHIALMNAHADKEQLRDQLKTEVARLEADLAFAARENERIRQVQQNRRRSARHKPSEPASPNADELLGLIKRHLLPPGKDPEPDVAQQLFDAAFDPTCWFSLGSSTAGPQPLSVAGPRPQTQEELPKPISHDPIPMSAEEQRPFLQAFTPFTFTSSTTILPPEPEGEEEEGAEKQEHRSSDGTLFRQHNISVASASPLGLFAAKLELVVNTSTFRIAELRVPRLEPTAIAELGPFLENVCVQTRNVSVACWAMAEWYRISVERARFWCSLDEVVGDRDALVRMVSEARRASKRRYRKRRDEHGDGVENDDDDESQGVSAARDSDKSKQGRLGEAGDVTRAAALAHMGRTAFEVPIPQDGVDEARWACLRVQWKIEFDWTGEGTSRVGVLVGVPGKWHDADDARALQGIQKVFADLVAGDGAPSTAVRIVIALLAGHVDASRSRDDVVS